MKLTELLTEDRAVSPVIGVILMVAITVILAAVIGTFVLGLGDRVSESSPQTQLGFEYTSQSAGGDLLDITHDGGDALSASELSIASNGDLSIDGDSDGAWDDGTNSSSVQLTDFGYGSSDTLSAGDTINVAGATDGSNADLSDDTVRVIWNSPSSDKTTTLAKWEGSSA